MMSGRLCVPGNIVDICMRGQEVFNRVFIRAGVAEKCFLPRKASSDGATVRPVIHIKHPRNTANSHINLHFLG
jgi:hypothetical protein